MTANKQMVTHIGPDPEYKPPEITEVSRQVLTEASWLVRCEELWRDPDWEDTPSKRTVIRTIGGDYVCSPDFVDWMIREDIRPEKREPQHHVCSVGFSPTQQRWFGWSHRAACGFGLGDRVFQEDAPGCTDQTPFLQHGTVVIETLDQARQAACNFAEYVS